VTNHTSHSRVANPASLQVCFPNYFPYYNPGRRIEANLHINTHKKWLHFLRERGISRPHAKLEIVVSIE
jgi:hypothetical protein